mmetsp:Transcript_4229/g.6232  ORF Transcript_4229/g.6232 Transcript_4229/m.6232 type:complete len:281 (+) Transcript_4229:57-899(+)
MDISIIVTLFLVLGTAALLYLKFVKGRNENQNEGPIQNDEGSDSKQTKKFQPQEQTQVVVLGLNDTGKTTLLYKLKSGEFRECYSSQKMNIMKFPLLGAKQYTNEVQFVDIPGHSRMRANSVQEIARAKGIIFLVDSLLSTTRMPSIAMYLYNVLTHPAVIEQQIPLLLVCNKSATSLYHAKDIRKLLERELDSMVKTKKRDIGSISADDQDLVYELVETTEKSSSNLLESDSDEEDDAETMKPFNFDTNCRSPVTCIDADVVKQVNIDKIQKFVEQLHK